MPEEEPQNPLNPNLGDLNQLSEPTISDKSGTGPSNVRSGTYQTQERNKRAREAKLLTNKDEYVALVLLVETVKSSFEPGTQPTSVVDKEGDTLKTYLKIYARVPELDSSIPLPDIFKNFVPSSVGVKTKCISRDVALIKQHPFFIKELTGTKEEQPKEPSAGDLIRVKYNNKQHTSGEFIEIFKEGYRFGKIITPTGSTDVQTSEDNRNKFSRSAQNIIISDRGPLVEVNPIENEVLEKRVNTIWNNTLPGPIVNGQETVIMFNLSRTSGLGTTYNSFDLSHYGGRKHGLKNLFIILDKKEVIKPAIRVLLMAQSEGYTLNINSSFRPSFKNLTVGNILEAVKKAKYAGAPESYSNWNRITQDSPVGEINPNALIELLEGFDANTKILSSQQSLRDYFDCPNNTTTNCRVKVARVGTSKHETGFAIDFNTKPAKVYTWLVNNMYKYGFYRSVKSERWHWRFKNSKESNKKIRVFSVIDRLHDSWDGNSLPTTDAIGSMPLQADDSDE